MAAQPAGSRRHALSLVTRAHCPSPQGPLDSRWPYLWPTCHWFGEPLRKASRFPPHPDSTQAAGRRGQLACHSSCVQAGQAGPLQFPEVTCHPHARLLLTSQPSLLSEPRLLTWPHWHCSWQGPASLLMGERPCWMQQEGGHSPCSRHCLSSRWFRTSQLLPSWGLGSNPGPHTLQAPPQPQPQTPSFLTWFNHV